MTLAVDNYDMQQLLENISAAWLTETSPPLYELPIQCRGRNKKRPTNAHLRFSAQTNHHEQTISPLELFNDSQQSLLILSAAGGGKTTVLRHLLAELLHQAQTEPQTPIPLLFNLASWHGGDLRVWLEQEAYQLYRLAPMSMKERLATAAFTLLLDGLDELPAAQRRESTVALQKFLQDYSGGLALSCNIGVYKTLPTTGLTFGETAVLQPWSEAQIEAYVAPGEESWRLLSTLLQSERRWRELTRSPLMLSLLTQLFSGATRPEVRELATADSKEEALLAAYATQQLAKTSAQENVAYEQATAGPWLATIAQWLQKSGRAIFRLEEMQADLLPLKFRAQYRRSYGTLLGLVVGLFLGLFDPLLQALFIGLATPAEVGWGTLLGRALNAGWFGALIKAVGAAWGMNLGVRFSARGPQGRPRFLFAGLIAWLIYALVVGSSEGLSGGLLDRLAFGLGIFIVGGLAGISATIGMKKRLRFIWPTRPRIGVAMRGALYYGGITAAIIGLLAGLFAALIDGLGFGLIFGGFFALGTSIFSLLLALLLAFIGTPPVDERPRPGQGVRHALVNAWLMTGVSALVFGLPAWLVDSQIGNYFFLRLLLNVVLPPIFAYYGGLSYIQHMTLRYALQRQGVLPFKLVPFLEAMVQRNLLKKVGGGYSFIHSALLEYFAALYEAGSNNNASHSK